MAHVTQDVCMRARAEATRTGRAGKCGPRVSCCFSRRICSAFCFQTSISSWRRRGVRPTLAQPVAWKPPRVTQGSTCCADAPSYPTPDANPKENATGFAWVEPATPGLMVFCDAGVGNPTNGADACRISKRLLPLDASRGPTSLGETALDTPMGRLGAPTENSTHGYTQTHAHTRNHAPAPAHTGRAPAHHTFTYPHNRTPTHSHYRTLAHAHVHAYGTISGPRASLPASI